MKERKKSAPQLPGKFIGSIVGLNIDAAKMAFSRFINSPLNPQQIRFVDTIIQCLSVKGVIDIGALLSRSFTDISGNGLIDVFKPEDSVEIISLVKVVNDNAMVA